MSLQDFSVAIASAPDAGPPKERGVAVVATIPFDVDVTALSGEPLELTLQYGNGESGIFTDITTESEPVVTVGERTYEYTVLVPAKEAYTLRVRGTLDTPSGKVTDKASVEVTGFEDDVQRGETDAPTVPTEVGTIGGERRADVTPEIAGIEPISLNTKYNIPFKRESNQTDSGKTIMVQNGDKNWRVTIEAIMSLDQFRQLQQLRRKPRIEKVPVTTAEFGTVRVDFDNIACQRPSQEDVGEIDETIGPLIKVQIQSKEKKQSGLFGGDQ